MGSMHAMGCINDIVYILGGHGNVINEAYNTVTKAWSKVAPCPAIAHHYSGGLMKNKICITNYTEGNAYIYDPIANKYDIQMKLPTGCWMPAGHGYIFTNWNMYQMQDDDTNSWKALAYVNGAPAFNSYHGISYVFKRGRYLYAIDHGYQVWQIDTKLCGAKRLAIP